MKLLNKRSVYREGVHKKRTLRPAEGKETAKNTNPPEEREQQRTKKEAELLGMTKCY